MATLVINTSHQPINLKTLGVVLNPGDKREFGCTEKELLSLCLELHNHKARGRVLVSEDAEIVDVQTLK